MDSDTETKPTNPATGHDDDSDSDDDHIFYGDAESNIAYITADSLKRANGFRESHIGELAADSIKISTLPRESHIGERANDSIKIPQPAEHHKFSFHNFGFHPTPFTDLMNTFVTMRNSYNQTKAAYDATHKEAPRQKSRGNSPFKKRSGDYTNTFDIKEFQKTQTKMKTNHKISRFREAPLKWDASAPDERLLKELYRACESDPSGKRIFDLARDGAKGATPWRPAEFDKDIAPPSITSLSPPFQKMVMQHMDSVVAQVEAEYAKLPTKTQAQNEVKARVGADLANLVRKREIIRKELKQGVKDESS
eukprot:gene21252-24116_t